ncbi:subunit of tubulin prefoldin [Steccherinum ochraceum]|uniref:Subunit of tubulin prefoldin n=1 Tax=Steccherinum ochraceum TaxID=92696 RepID=A0A4R0R1X6_9APHY|nr:subunit of tubulin prefoldin [Steccherinum ochraceum]
MDGVFFACFANDRTARLWRVLSIVYRALAVEVVVGLLNQHHSPRSQATRDMAAPQQQQINLQDLDLQQLADVRRQLEEELSHLTNSFTQLKQAQAKFMSCMENVAEVKKQNKDKVILVPLTNSLYVPGKLCDTENVIVDVGTGYFVKKSRAEARKHYEAKVEFIRSNVENLQEMISKKQENMNYLVNVMQMKLQEQTSAAAKASK